MAQIAEEGDAEEEGEDEEHSDADEDDEDTAGEEEDSQALSPSAPLTLENLHLHPSTQLPNDGDSDDDAVPGVDDDDEGTEGASVAGTSETGRTDDDISTVAGQKSRRRKPARTPAPTAADVGSIVTERLARAKKSTERQHHGKKMASSSVLGKQKGSKMRMDTNRAIKESSEF